MNEQQLTGLRTVAPAALGAESALQLPRAFSIVSIVQSIAESSTKKGWWTSLLFKDKNNPFGIKVGHRQGHNYGHFDASTWEIENGKRVEMVAEFQTFPNLREAFMAHAVLLLRPMYRPAFDASRDPKRDLAGQVRTCAERLGPKLPACPVHGIPMVSQTPGHAAEVYSGNLCPVCALPLFMENDPLHCGYCTNPNYGHLLWTLVQECGLLDPGRLEELAR